MLRCRWNGPPEDATPILRPCNGNPGATLSNTSVFDMAVTTTMVVTWNKIEEEFQD